MPHYVDESTQTDTACTPSSINCPTPEFEVGDEVTKAKLPYRTESSIGRAIFSWEEDREENISYNHHTQPMTFIVQARCYDEEDGRWCYMGRASPRFCSVELDNVGVWAWNWETAKPKFKVDQAVRIKLGDEVLPAKITSIDWLPQGMHYDVDLGLAEFPKEEAEVIGHKDQSTEIYRIGRNGIFFSGPCDYKVEQDEVSVLGLNVSYSDLPEDAVIDTRARVPLCLTPAAQDAKNQKEDVLLPRPRCSWSHMPQGSTVPPPDQIFDEGEVAVVHSYHGAFASVSIYGDANTYRGTYSFGKFLCPSYRDLWNTWRCCFELFDLTSTDDKDIELHADRQEWLCEGEKVQPLVSYGLLKTGFRYETLYHAGDAVIAAFRDGSRIESRVQRVALKVESGKLHEFYDLVSEEGRFERIPGNCAVKPYYGYDYEMGIIGAYWSIQNFKHQMKRWHAGEQHYEPQPDRDFVHTDIAILSCAGEEAMEN